MRQTELFESFDEALTVLKPMGHGVIITHARALMNVGEFEEARRFVQEAARRLGLGALSDLGREIGLWHHARGTVESLQQSQRWQASSAKEQSLWKQLEALHKNPEIQRLLALEIGDLTEEIQTTQGRCTIEDRAANSETSAQTQVWVRPPKVLDSGESALGRERKQVEKTPDDFERMGSMGEASGAHEIRHAGNGHMLTPRMAGFLVVFGMICLAVAAWVVADAMN